MVLIDADWKCRSLTGETSKGKVDVKWDIVGVISRAILFAIIGLNSGCGGSSATGSPGTEAEMAMRITGEESEALTFYGNDLCLTNSRVCYDISGKTYLYSVKWNEEFYIVLYDGEKNVAGSSGQESYFDGLELHVLDKQKMTYVANFFYESSIDSFFRSASDENSLVICASNECSLFRKDRSTTRFSAAEVEDSLIVTGLQLAKDGDGYLVFLKESFPIEKVGEIDSTEYRAFSSHLNKEFILSAVDEISNSELLQVITDEASNIDREFFLRQNNLEGRISWGQHYILDWYILQKKMGKINQEREARLEENITFYIEKNVRDLLTSRRYSMDRRDALFLLHISRLGQILDSYKALKGSLANEASFLRFRSELTRYLGLADVVTVETIKPTFFRGLNETRPYLVFSRNSAFWADGANVPLNYVSDYIIALIGNNDEDSKERAELLLATHYDFLWKPLSPSWLYWFGDGLYGWDDISTNTRDYKGDESGNAADITYRSADAMAFLSWCASFPDYNESFDCENVSDDIYDLVLSGNLEPHLLRFFLDMEPTLNISAVTRFSRLSYINDLRNLLFLQ